MQRRSMRRDENAASATDEASDSARDGGRGFAGGKHRVRGAIRAPRERCGATRTRRAAAARRSTAEPNRFALREVGAPRDSLIVPREEGPLPGHGDTRPRVKTRAAIERR